jgi:hypothetical protein
MDPTVALSSTTDFPDRQQLPQELQGPVPREVPQAVKHSRLARSQRAIVWGCFISGLLCVGADGLPFVETLSLYILPLGYLLWIGIGLCVIAGIVHLNPRTLRMARRYIEHGEAGFGRVLALAKTPTMIVHGRPTTYAIAAKLQVRHPKTGEMCECHMKSRSFGSSEKDQVSARFRVGDAVPVVWIPGEFERTAQIYDFLEVMPEHSLVYRSKPKPLWMTLALLVMVAAFFLTLLWNLYATEKYSPIDFDWVSQGGLPILVGAVLGLAALVAIAISLARERSRAAQRNAEALRTGDAVELIVPKAMFKRIGFGVLMTLGAVLLGGITTMSICMTANAIFDKSPRVLVPVQITNMVEITHEFLFREYKLQFRRAQDVRDIELLTTPQHLDQFTAPVGIAHVRSGRFGWHWVETVEPIQVAVKPR